MGFLMLLARKQHLQAASDNIQYKLMDINSKMNDLTSFTSILSQDSIDITDLASLPASLFGAGFAELQNSSMAAYNMANNEYALLTSNGYGNNANPQALQVAHMKLFENARKQMLKPLIIRLNEQEKSLKNEKTRLETQDSQYTKELESLDQKISQGINSSISSYGLRA